MDQKNIKEITFFFSQYAKSFYDSDLETTKTLKIKEGHSYRVKDEIISLGKSIKLNKYDLMILEITAILHDIGRFPQFKKYKTLVDIHSEDHAKLGVSEIKKLNILKNLSNAEQNIILKSILFHNKSKIPTKSNNEEWILYAKCIRDADKLDIYNVITKYYEKLDKNTLKNISLGLPNNNSYNKKIISDIYKNHFVNINDIKEANDLKLLQISWIFDINFIASMKKISDKKYIDIIIKSLPKTKQISDLHKFILDYITKYINK